MLLSHQEGARDIPHIKIALILPAEGLKLKRLTTPHAGAGVEQPETLIHYRQKCQIVQLL